MLDQKSIGYVISNQKVVNEETKIVGKQPVEAGKKSSNTVSGEIISILKQNVYDRNKDKLAIF